MNELSSHLNSSGEARMVDISEKAITVRVAKAECKVVVSTEVISLIKNDELPKGDALSVARIAGIQAAKKTPDLIPLAHPIALHGIDISMDVQENGVLIQIGRAHV